MRQSRERQQELPDTITLRAFTQREALGQKEQYSHTHGDGPLRILTRHGGTTHLY